MKQLTENLRTGSISISEVPAPSLKPGGVLVRTHFSVISKGTESGTVELGKKSLVGKALARPEQAAKVIDLALRQGPLTAYQIAMRALDMPIPLGYSLAGEVIAVAPGVTALKPGDKVACGGAGLANHAEVVAVPQTLCAKLDPNADLKAAAFSTIGAIALQSVRVSKASIGETVVVIGLGLVGLLCTSILRAAGCRVIGVEPNKERLQLAKRFGLEAGVPPESEPAVALISEFTSSHGADAVIVTASSEDNGPVKLAGELARVKGRVVVVGRTQMTAPRETFLFKELELSTSMAYGPGTGDPSYEQDGRDYPYPYVRWTEQRNIEAFAALAHQGKVDCGALMSHEFALDDAADAFDLITGENAGQTIGVVLRYDAAESVEPMGAPATRIALPATRRVAGDGVRVGVIGAGSYAGNEFLPLLGRQKGVALTGLGSAGGLKAEALGKRYGFEFCTSDPMDIVQDQRTDAVIVLTRHGDHADLTLAALKAGKHVFVEKPLALTQEQVDTIEAAWREAGVQLFVGFNRRYAPKLQALKQYIDGPGPAAIRYRANIGSRPLEHWLHHPIDGGGVIIGEACHHIDVCNWLVGEAPVTVKAFALGRGEDPLHADTAHITLRYPGGSLATVQYVSNGDKRFAEEDVEVHRAGRSATLVDFKGLRCSGQFNWPHLGVPGPSDKGHAAQLADFIACLREEKQRDAALYFASSRAAINASSQIGPLGEPSGLGVEELSPD